MPRKRHKPEEIVTKLRQVDVLVSAIRQIGVAEVTYYRWGQEFARRPIEHPNRQFQQSTRRAVVMAAADYFARRLLDHLMNMNNASCPRMPRVKDLALLGPMGVLSSRCTMAPTAFGP
jgi:hypothetical protein